MPQKKRRFACDISYNPKRRFHTRIADFAHCPRASPVATVVGMDNDTTFKRIFSHQIMVRELLDWFVGRLMDGREVVASLDLSKLRRASEQTVGGRPDDLHRFAADVVWEAPFAESPDPDPKAWLELMLLWEFQRTPDHFMPMRVRNYVDSHHMDAWRARDRRFGATDRLPPVLPIVIYTGREQWTAARRVIDLVSPEPDGPQEPLDLSSRRSGLFAGDGYLLLDIQRLSPDDYDNDNAVSLLAELTSPPADAARTAQLAVRLIERLAGEDLDLRKVLVEWVRQESGLDLGVEQMITVNELTPAQRETYVQDRLEPWWNRLRAEGLAQGRADEREHLVRMAELKFDANTASRLARLIADTDDAGELADVGGWIITCQSGDDLLAQASKGANGRG